MSHIDFEEILEIEPTTIDTDVTDMLLVIAIAVCFIKLIQSLRV
jgi:hypothetical protein